MDRKPASPAPVSLNDASDSEFNTICVKLGSWREPLTERETKIALLCVRAISKDFHAEESGRAKPPGKHDFAQEDDYRFPDVYGIQEMIDSDGNLRVRGKVVKVRWINQWAAFTDIENNRNDEMYFVGLAYDPRGTFYGVSGLCVDSDVHRVAVEKLTGKRALLWFAQRFSHDKKFTRELCRAIDNPAFEFMDIVPTSALPKRTRKAAKVAEVFHEQLHLATALVECVRKLEDAPTLENLADACRSVSSLHAAIHAPENFKLAAHS